MTEGGERTRGCTKTAEDVDRVRARARARRKGGDIKRWRGGEDAWRERVQERCITQENSVNKKSGSLNERE